MGLLNQIEIGCCFLIWITGVVVSLYRLYFVGQVFDHNLHDQYHYDDFSKGWSILGNRFQDQADYEWNVWTKLTLKLSPILFLNLTVAETLRYKKLNNYIPIWYAFLAICALMYIFNTTIMLCFIMNIFVYFICLYLNNYTSIWIISFIIRHYFKPEIWLKVNEDDHYLIIVSSSWMILRCVSYTVDKLKNSALKSAAFKRLPFEFLTMLGYTLYLPTMFCGPFILFEHFDKSVQLSYEKWNLWRIVKISFKFVRCLFWFLFTQLALHFIYVNAILLRPHFVRGLFDWELAGLGIAMGHFFHLKYVVFYGIPSAWAAAERIETPESPCCVSRVHLYSYMWRHFDHGLYQFLVKYIYIPTKTYFTVNDFLSKLLASIACFSFVYVWHGEEDYVFCWVLFNFVAVTIEAFAKDFFNLPYVKRPIERNVSRENLLRLQCLLSAPLHYFSMVSNYYFIGMGMDVGNVYLDRFLRGSIRSKLVILFFLYGAGQSAVRIQIWQSRRKVKEKTI